MNVNGNFLGRITTSRDSLIFKLISRRVKIVITFALTITMNTVFVCTETVAAQDEDAFCSVSTYYTTKLFIIRLSLGIFNTASILPLANMAFPFISTNNSDVVSY